ncbi:MAG: MFS transporter [Rhodobacteraceae bacterium]|nr:MFS transporter [Paracoccaceae bacterium]
MLLVFRNSWPLLLGMMLFMLGNGLQATLLGVRGALEGFGPFEMSVVMSAYFVGFLAGSRMAPRMIRRVGHVRVFAALGSMISAVLILYPALLHPMAWVGLRVLIGFCFAGVYVVAESWLNDQATNETRGQTLSLYLIVQMVGIITAQGMITLADPGGFVLFIIPSVLVSLAFAPILLSVAPAPSFQSTKPMTLRELFTISPLGMMGAFLLGGVFGAQFGMAPVYATEAGLTVNRIAIFIGAIYVGGLICQYPLGWLSDRMDRRRMILGLAAFCGLAMAVAVFVGHVYAALLVAAFVMGGGSHALYALFIAHTNDMLEPADMAAASGGLIFVNGLGAVAGPLIVGALMGTIGPAGYFLYLAVLLAVIAAYTAWRMTRRVGLPVEETGAYAPITPIATTVVMEATLEVAEAATQDAVAQAAQEAEDAGEAESEAARLAEAGEGR